MKRFQDNFKKFLLKLVILGAVVFLSRALFQFPIEYLGFDIFKQTYANRVFSKVDAMKVLALVGLFFALFYRKRIEKISHPRPDLKRFALFLIAGLASICIYYIVRGSTNYYGITSGPMMYLGWAAIFVLLLLALFLYTLAVFGTGYVKELYSSFRDEFLLAGAASVVLYNLLVFFQNQWYAISSTVAYILYLMLSRFFEVGYFIGQGAPVLEVRGFAVNIGAPCSGIDSMLLFFSFFTALFALDYRRLKKKLYMLLFLVGLLGVFFVNVLRLFLLIVAGVYVSPDFAVGLFHTNAGWIFFLFYFLAYYWLIRRFIYVS
jgi:exosortase/archaeosortase family protein